MIQILLFLFILYTTVSPLSAEGPAKTAPGKFKKITKRRSSLKDLSEGLAPLPAAFDGIDQKRAAFKGSRYNSVKLNAAQALDELNFWMPQFAEHAFFLHLGIENKRLKRKALTLHQKIDNYSKRMSADNLDESLLLLRALRNFKIELLRTLQDGTWLGWIFHSWVRHMIIELDYTVDKLNNIIYTAHEETAFWNTINGDHAGTASHLVDTSEKDANKQLAAFSEKFRSLNSPEKDAMIHLSLTAAKELDAFNKESRKKSQNKQLKSVIHPALLDHVIKEGERSIAILQQLK